jgi:[amino group carrier protein]-L-2-aminoadipate 6-kinase
MIVVKIGGSQGVNLAAVCEDVAFLVNQGQKVIMVHGGSAETNDLSVQLGHPPRFLTTTTGFTSRYTNRPTLEIFAMVTAGKINTLLVELLQKMGVNALGLSGLDGRLMIAQRKEAIVVVENGRKQVIRDDYHRKDRAGQCSTIESSTRFWLYSRDCAAGDLNKRGSAQRRC